MNLYLVGTLWIFGVRNKNANNRFLLRGKGIFCLFRKGQVFINNILHGKFTYVFCYLLINNTHIY